MREWGVDAATWGIRALLQDAGLRGVNGEPPSEALTWVLAGGIGFGTVAAPVGSPVRWFVSGRHAWHGDQAYVVQACDRIGLQIAQLETEDFGVSAMMLQRWLAEEEPCVLAWVDASLLPWHALPEAWRGLTPRVVVLRGVDAAGVQVEDLHATPRHLSEAALTAARAAAPRHKGRLIKLADGPQFIDMGGALKRGIQACVHGLRRGHSDISGLKGMRAWAGYLVRADAFQEHFESPPDVLDALLDFERRVEAQGALGRALFADGLGEASQVLRDPVLREQREVWSEIASSWVDLARRMLPREPGLGELSRLGVRIERGIGAGIDANEMGELRARFAELRDEQALTWVPAAHDLNSHLSGLGHRLLALVNREEDALDDLALWAGL